MTKVVSFKSKRQFYLRSERNHRLMHSPWAGGVILVIFAVIALILANIPGVNHVYHDILMWKFTVGFENANITKSVEGWINDGLMVIFFFYVGLEIKREIIAGQLSNIKQASLPIAAAIGGMIFPAIIYTVFNAGTPYESGWGIPMATDIAFAIGVLSLLGNRVPLSLKIFLTALAIVDDLGAIIVIAIFYSSSINLIALGLCFAIMILLLYLNKYNVYKMRYYVIPSIILWVLFLYSGVHATIAGVLIALAIPTTPRFSKKYFLYKNRYYVNSFIHHDKESVEVLANQQQLFDLTTITRIVANTVSPAQRLEYKLHYFVAFFIMPVFALANAGVELSDLDDLRIFTTSSGLGIFFGLVVGKPLGIMLFSWLTIRFGFGVMPKGADWKSLLGVAMLGGIGLTMSIFIDNLAFSSAAAVSQGKIAILMASTAAAVIGYFYVRLVVKRRIADPKTKIYNH